VAALLSGLAFGLETFSSGNTQVASDPDLVYVPPAASHSRSDPDAASTLVVLKANSDMDASIASEYARSMAVFSLSLNLLFKSIKRNAHGSARLSARQPWLILA
jgi:hypothetical protein